MSQPREPAGRVGGGQRDEGMVAWVSASCAAQGLPVKVTDAGVLQEVCVLLGGKVAGRRSARGADRRARKASEAPAGLDSRRVEPSGPCRARGDHGVVEDRSDDGVLSNEVEAGPLVAQRLSVARQAGEGL